MVLKPSSRIRHMTVAKSAVKLVLPAHRPAVMVADVSNPNLQARAILCQVAMQLDLPPCHPACIHTAGLEACNAQGGCKAAAARQAEVHTS